jgi:hypothetical protein
LAARLPPDSRAGAPPPQHASKPAAHPSPHATAALCLAGSPVPASHPDAAWPPLLLCSNRRVGQHRRVDAVATTAGLTPPLHELTCRRCPSRLVTGRRLEKPLELAGVELAGKISPPRTALRRL